MSGVFKKTAEPVARQAAESGMFKQPQTEKPMSQQVTEDRSARRRARRGGRALLSDSRLNPEQGVSTLGSQGL